MKRMKKTGNPVVLTINGRAEVVVQEAAAYQRLRELADKAEMLEFLRASKADAEAGRTVPAREFLESLGKRKRSKRA
jgi:PHD/YefM family antitoxin component YafN of YafNO toxin-antitoxin module